MNLLTSMMGDLYDLSDVLLNAADFALPCVRRRRYCVLVLRRHARLTRPLADLPGAVCHLLGPNLVANDLVFDKPVTIQLSESAARYKKAYDRLGFGADAFYDLSQNP